MFLFGFALVMIAGAGLAVVLAVAYYIHTVRSLLRGEQEQLRAPR